MLGVAHPVNAGWYMAHLMFTLISASQNKAHYLLVLVVGAVLLPLLRVSTQWVPSSSWRWRLSIEKKTKHDDEGKHSLFACASDWGGLWSNPMNICKVDFSPMKCLSSHILKASSVSTDTISFDSLFQCPITLLVKNYCQSLALLCLMTSLCRWPLPLFTLLISNISWK